MAPETIQRAAIEARRVSMSFGTSRILADLDLTVHEGEFVALQGENGAGKSTLLDLLAGLEEPDSGSVRLFGRPPGEARIGFVWQDTQGSLYPWLSGLENAALPLSIAGLSRPERRSRVEALTERLGWDLPLARRPHQMSGGQQQRLAILRALIGNPAPPKLLLLDEALSDQDQGSRLRLMLDLQSLAKEWGTTVLFTSHALEETTYLADRVLCLQGRPALIPGESIVEVPCPHQRPRPTGWLSEPTFDAALLHVRHGIAKRQVRGAIR